MWKDTNNRMMMGPTTEQPQRGERLTQSLGWEQVNLVICGTQCKWEMQSPFENYG